MTGVGTVLASLMNCVSQPTAGAVWDGVQSSSTAGPRSLLISGRTRVALILPGQNNARANNLSFAGPQMRRNPHASPENKPSGAGAVGTALLLHMPGDQFGHLEHADLLLAIEDGLQGLVAIDESLLLLVLQPVLANISPKFFGQFRARDRTVANNPGQLFVRLNRLHKSGAGFPFCFRCFRFGSHASI